MSNFSSSDVPDFGDTVHMRFKAALASDLSIQDKQEYTPVSKNFIAGLLNLSYNEALYSFSDFYSKMFQDLEENQEDLKSYSKLFNLLGSRKIEEFKEYLNGLDTFVRHSIPQPVILFISLHDSFIIKKD